MGLSDLVGLHGGARPPLMVFHFSRRGANSDRGFKPYHSVSVPKHVDLVHQAGPRACAAHHCVLVKTSVEKCREKTPVREEFFEKCIPRTPDH